MAKSNFKNYADYYEVFEWLDYVSNRVDPAVADHIAGLLSRYLDTAESSPGEKLAEFEAIAAEVTEKIRAHVSVEGLALVPNLRTDKPPFYFGTWGGIGAVYVSLARFLSSKYVERLRRCPYCKSLFVAPDNRKHKFCPGTDHKKRHWNEEHARTGYHAQDMAERRDPDSPKFDAKYIRE